MTWTAAAVARAVASHRAGDGASRRREPPAEWRVIHLAGARPSSRAVELTRLGVRESDVLRRAARHAMIERRRGRDVRLAAAGSALVAAAAAAVLGVVAAAIALGLVAAALAAWWLASRSGHEHGLDAAAADIEAARDAHPESHEALVDELLALVAVNARDTCVVIDDFGALDDLTCAVLDQYLTSGMPGAEGHQLWVVLETAGAAELWPDLIALAEPFERPTYSRRRLRIFELVPLTEREREELADRVGRQDRADFRAAGEIAVDEDAELQTPAAVELRQLLDSVHRLGGAEDQGDALDFLYLLAVTTRTRGHVRFSRSTLERTMSSHTRTGGRWELLHAARPHADISLSGLRASLAEIEKSFGRLLEDVGPDAIALDPLAARVLINRRGAYELPDLQLSHAFWALYWHDTKGAALEPYWLRKLAGHLLEATASEDGLRGFSSDVAERLLITSLESISRCLRLSFVSDMAGLIAGAARLLDRLGPRARERERLRGYAWQAFALLGDETILALCMSLGADEPQARADGRSDRLIRLFGDAMLGAEPAQRELVVQRLGALDAAAEAYAQVRAAWLVLVAADVARQGAETWAPALAAIAETVPEAVAQASVRLEAGSDARVAADVATVSLGCWVLTLATLSGSVRLDVTLEALSAAYVLSDGLHGRFGSSEDRYDLVLDGLRLDLLLSAGAGAATLARRFGHRDARDLRPLIEDAADVGGRRARDQAGAIERRLGLAELMWRRMGFDQLRAFASLRRAHYAALLQLARYDEVRESLWEDVDRTDQLGLVANLVISAPARDYEHAQHVVYGAETAVETGIGPELGADLALYALLECQGNSAISITPLVEWLFRAGPGGSRPIDEGRLGRLDEGRLPTLALSLLNAAAGLKGEVPDAVCGVLERACDGVDDEVVRDATRQEVDVFRLARELDERAGSYETNNVIASWQNRGNGMNYARVLNLLLDRDVSHLKALAEAIGLLHRLEEPSRSSPVWLAVNVLDSLAKPAAQEHFDNHEIVDGVRVAKDFLVRWHPHWIGQFSGLQNVVILQRLVRYDRRNAQAHHERLAFEEARRQREELELKLLPLRRLGRFFELVWHYFRTLEWWGLETSPEVLGRDIETMSADARRALVDLHIGASPPAFESDVLSGTFLQVGYAVYHEPALGGGDYDALRDSVTSEAEGAVARLIEQATTLPRLSEEIRVVLRHHRDVLDLPDYVTA